MNSIIVDRVSKVYRKTRTEFSPWQQFTAKLRGEPQQKKPAREIWALKNVSFTVEPGTILGVIGPNGAGKTTLLKVLARVTPPSEGRVVGRGLVAPLLELGTGLQPDLTARENVILYAAWHGIPQQEIEARLDDIIEFAELKEFVDSPLKYFSSGMYVRLAFSLAINMRPDILLADEILAVGDIAFQERCLQRVQDAGASGMTVLFVSHDMAAIQRLCHRVLWLNGGQVMEDGDPTTVVEHYEQSAWTLAGGTAKQGKKGRHTSEHGELLSIRMTSADGREIGAVQHNEEVHLSLRYTVMAPRAVVRAAFAVYTRGVLAFRAVQPEDFIVTEPGVYRTTVRIPPNLLADTIYSVKPGIFLSVDDQEAQLVLDNALNFRVYAAETEGERLLLTRGNYRGSSMAGAVMPRLDFEIVREREVITT